MHFWTWTVASERGGAWEPANTGGHSELSNWVGISGEVRAGRAGFLPLKSTLGRATALLIQTPGDRD